MSPATPDTDALLSRAAELRARGASWEAAADELDADPDDLRRLTRDAGPAYRRLFAAARREVTDEAFGEALLALRRELRSRDERARREAAGVIVRIRLTAIRHLARRKAGGGTGAAPPALGRRADAERLVDFLSEHTDEELDTFVRERARPQLLQRWGYTEAEDPVFVGRVESSRPDAAGALRRASSQSLLDPTYEDPSDEDGADGPDDPPGGPKVPRQPCNPDSGASGACPDPRVCDAAERGRGDNSQPPEETKTTPDASAHTRGAHAPRSPGSWLPAEPADSSAWSADALLPQYGRQVPVDAAADQELVVVEPAADRRAQGEVLGHHRPNHCVDQLQRLERVIPVGRALHADPLQPLEQVGQPTQRDPRRGEPQGLRVGDRQPGPLPLVGAPQEQPVLRLVEDAVARVLVADGEPADRQPQPLRREQCVGRVLPAAGVERRQEPLRLGPEPELAQRPEDGPRGQLEGPPQVVVPGTHAAYEELDDRGGRGELPGPRGRGEPGLEHSALEARQQVGPLALRPRPDLQPRLDPVERRQELGEHPGDQRVVEVRGEFEQREGDPRDGGRRRLGGTHGEQLTGFLRDGSRVGAVGQDVQPLAEQVGAAERAQVEPAERPHPVVGFEDAGGVAEAVHGEPQEVRQPVVAV